MWQERVKKKKNQKKNHISPSINKCSTLKWDYSKQIIKYLKIVHANLWRSNIRGLNWGVQFLSSQMQWGEAMMLRAYQALVV